MTRRIFDVRQQGSRISWSDSLFEQVEPARPAITDDGFPITEPVPLLVCEVDIAEWDAAVAAQQRRGGL